MHLVTTQPLQYGVGSCVEEQRKRVRNLSIHPYITTHALVSLCQGLAFSHPPNPSGLECSATARSTGRTQSCASIIPLINKTLPKRPFAINANARPARIPHYRPEADSSIFASSDQITASAQKQTKGYLASESKLLLISLGHSDRP